MISICKYDAATGDGKDRGLPTMAFTIIPICH